MVTHTVPDPALIAHDIDLEGSMNSTPWATDS
jgi:hypothetical protein